ncbi:heavy metal translocating P-type ATPase [Methanococcus vannielii SB]|uniref:Heavy metal translocating P-type ATPase n=1 Tax=Methanococcus vannielii (strain ATCC 35089 / DSM 1224 / JCM 13029 / OCM 148 / SB) TaxID=406327 RepID=A6URK7_METVS|nr:heavy metal translocating P-type ATPase [Methanococcus vannielii]ABR55129.1 heavy metal translocating P-type ATPase [Methanococcus vannielii SB]
MYRHYELKGLCCANCALKIERILCENGYPSARINFSTSELLFAEKSVDINFVKKLIHSIEPEIILIEKENLDYKLSSNLTFKDFVDFKELKIIIFSLILFIFGIFGSYLNFEPFIVLMIFLTSYMISGNKVFKKTFKNVKRGDFFDENFLMTIATVGAFLIHEYPEGVAVMLFYRIGEFLQDLAVSKSRSSVKSLLSLKAEYANLKKDDKLLKVSPETVKKGQIIIINPGEKTPLDGIILNGNSSIDVSALTGESSPRYLKDGDEILSGMVNLTGPLTVKVTKEFEESTVYKILELIETANVKKAKTEKFVTKFARYYTPFIVFLAFLVVAIPILAFNEPIIPWVYKALVLLVISCPCALVLSIPLSYFAGIGKLSKDGILVKGSNYIDMLSKTNYVIFDKTGTLTKGSLKVKEVFPKNGFSKEELIEIAITSESRSNHPVAKAIISKYGTNRFFEFSEYKEIPGKGIVAKIHGFEVISGNEKLMEESGIDVKPMDSFDIAVHFAIDKKYAGYILVSDELKKDSKNAILELKKLGIKKISMFTGDSYPVSKKISEEISIDEFYSDLLPKDKVTLLEEIERKKDKNESIVFVGEGINDAPAIKRADVGISMGTLGSDAAIESSDVVIMDDNPLKVAQSIKLSKRTKNIVWQNIFMIFGVKIAFITLSIFGRVTMWEAVFADVGITIISVLNSLRILK